LKEQVRTQKRVANAKLPNAALDSGVPAPEADRRGLVRTELGELHHLLNTGRGGELDEATLLIFGPLR
jgi:hypothetical protein